MVDQNPLLLSKTRNQNHQILLKKLQNQKSNLILKRNLLKIVNRKLQKLSKKHPKNQALVRNDKAGKRKFKRKIIES